MDDVPLDVANFLSYMNGTPSNDEFVQEIATTIQQLKMNEEERMNYMTFEMKLNEEREEGREEGRREQGRIKGFEFALKLLRRKMPVPEIHELTDLPEARILELAKENNLL
jgi:predicted transposase/invertase (TIGR01784 family)